MTRLWVRLSLVFSMVIFLAVLAIGITARINSAAFNNPDLHPPPEVIAYFEQLRMRPSPLDVTMVAVVMGVIAIAGGVWLSRSLTRPLSELEEGADAIGRQDLSHRVPVHGSKEMVAVATAFNDMAAQLEQEERLRRDLLADVSHELRHPVHIIQGNLQAILDDVYPLDKTEIAKLLEQTNHLSLLVQDLHVIAQADAHQLPLNKKATDIAALVKQTAAIFDAQAGAREIAIRVELLGTIPDHMFLDPGRMRQAVYNLLDNALRHSLARAVIMVRIHKENNQIKLIVQDFGEGIAEEKLPYIFERFYQTDKARPRKTDSTGLGLAIVKAIIEAHNGQIEAFSAGPGQGATFTISLPL